MTGSKPAFTLSSKNVSGRFKAKANSGKSNFPKFNAAWLCQRNSDATGRKRQWRPKPNCKDVEKRIPTVTWRRYIKKCGNHETTATTTSERKVTLAIMKGGFTVNVLICQNSFLESIQLDRIRRPNISTSHNTRTILLFQFEFRAGLFPTNVESLVKIAPTLCVSVFS